MSGLIPGDTVYDAVNETDDEIVIRKANKVSLPADIGSEFPETLSQVMEQYDETLKSLKDR